MLIFIAVCLPHTYLFFRIYSIVCFFFFYMTRPPLSSTLFPTRRSSDLPRRRRTRPRRHACASGTHPAKRRAGPPRDRKSTRLLQSPDHLVCRLLLEKKKKKIPNKNDQLHHPQDYAVELIQIT